MLDFNSLTSFQKGTYIFQHLQAAFSLIGVLGNILVICVFSRRSLKKYSYSFYSKAMAISDIVVLCHSFRHWARFMYNADIDLVSPFLCAINEYQPYVTVCLSLWILMLISIDRLATVVYPNRLKIIKERWCQAALVALVTIVNLLIFLEMPLNYTIVTIPQPGNSSIQMCVPPPEIGKISSWFLFVNIFVMAIIVNNILNLRMIIFIVRSRKKVATSLGINNISNTAVRDRKFARTTIGLNLSSFVLKMPICIGLLAAHYLNIEPEIIQMIFTINLMLATTDNAICIFVYLSLNSVFYDEFMEMFGLKRIKSILSSGKSSRRLIAPQSNNNSQNKNNHIRSTKY